MSEPNVEQLIARNRARLVSARNTAARARALLAATSPHPADAGAGVTNGKTMNLDETGPVSPRQDPHSPVSASVDADLRVEPKNGPKQPRRRHGKAKQSEEALPVTVTEEPILLTRRQAAAMCQIGLTTLDKWSKEPDFPIIRGHRLARIPRDELVEWVKRYTARRSGQYGYRPDLTPPRRRR